MNQMFAVGLAVLMAASMVTASMAQPKDQPAPKMEQTPKADKQSTVTGKIKSVDPSGSMVTLEDGTQLTIPQSLKASKADLKAGTMILVRFEEKGGQKVATSIEVKKGGS